MTLQGCSVIAHDIKHRIHLFLLIVSEIVHKSSFFRFLCFLHKFMFLNSLVMILNVVSFAAEIVFWYTKQRFSIVRKVVL